MTEILLYLIYFQAHYRRPCYKGHWRKTKRVEHYCGIFTVHIEQGLWSRLFSNFELKGEHEVRCDYMPLIPLLWRHKLEDLQV